MDNKLRNLNKISFLGIGGSGMRGLAGLLSEMNVSVVGIDQNRSALEGVKDLESASILPETSIEALLRDTRVLVYSDAVRIDHPARVRARQMNIIELGYHEALGELTEGYELVAVTGTHGKSSTTALLSHLLVESGLDPTVVIGAPVASFNDRHARLGASQLFVVEADEYREHFLSLSPKWIIMTSIDYDHPDYYASENDVIDAYNKFLGRITDSEGGVVVLNSLYGKYKNLNWPKNTITVSQQIADSMEVPIPGNHMKSNASLALTLALHLGVNEKMARKSIKSFPGLGRRFEDIGAVNQMKIISDYGHHPAELLATWQGAREYFKDKSMLMIVEIHTLDRLIQFENEFIDVFGMSDGLVLVPVFVPHGRESENSKTIALLKQLERKLPSQLKHWKIEEMGDLNDLLIKLSESYDVCIAFTAGRLDSALRKII